MKHLSALLACVAALLFARPAPAAEFDCMIEARQNVEIRSSVEAVIESVRVRRGDLVRKGQVVVTLQSGPERAALALAQSRAQNQGDIKLSEARLDIAAKKLKRAQELFAQNFISANARDEAERSAEVLALRTIRSPISGVVVDVMRRPGEFGAITFKDPILTLAEIDPLHIEAILPASMYGKIRNGQRAVVMPEPPIGGRYTTKVTVVDRVVDAGSGTLGVRLELANPKGAIPAGVRCRVSFLNDPS